MIKVENIEAWGFEHAVRGMRNPMNSWDSSDSHRYGTKGKFVIGLNDLTLMRRLYNGGTEHRKYLRQIFVSMDITAPLYWWKEFDTYKVGTVANSCSTMHKIAKKEFMLDDFSVEHLPGDVIEKPFRAIIETLNFYRDLYNTTRSKSDWWIMIQLLPESYNQRRTVTMNYENVVTIIEQRKGHKLDEWNNFIQILEALPYIRNVVG